MSTLLEELCQTLVPQASIDEQQQQQAQQRTLLNTTMCDDSNASSVMEDIDVSNTSSSSSTSSTSSNSSNSSSCSNGSVSGCATDTDTGKGSSTVGSLDVASVSSSSIGSSASITSVSTTAPSTTSISSGLGLVVDVDSNIGSSQELSHGYDAKSVTELDSLEDTCGSMLKDADKLCKLCR